MEPAIVVCLIIAFVFWLIRVARIVIHFFKLLEIRAFYKNALRISEVDNVLMKLNCGDSFTKQLPRTLTYKLHLQTRRWTTGNE